MTTKMINSIQTKSILKIAIPVMIALLSSCVTHVKTADRPEFDRESTGSSFERTHVDSSSRKISDKDFEKYAYELGFDPQKGLSSDETKLVNQRRQLRVLERSLNSEKERYHYSKVLPFLENDSEKISYLSIPSLEGRQAWINRNKIWMRQKSDDQYNEVISSQDLALGMTTEMVRKSWGEPESIEHSGNPIYKNERWKYLRESPAPTGYKRERRLVYFEGGRVVGWETE